MNPERKELVQEITAVSDHIAVLLRPLGNTASQIKRTDWAVGSAAAHLVISQKLSRQILTGEPNPYKNAKPETVAEVNKALLAEFPERRGDKLATMLVMHTEKFVKEIEKFPDTHRVKTHFGTMDVLTCLSYNLCHLLIHGSQIAQALNKKLLVHKKHIPMVLPFLKMAMLATYDKTALKDPNVSFVIHLDGISAFTVICKRDSIVVTEELPENADCHIKADPVAFFLIATGITSQWSALLKGKLIVWGRKPWLALQLTKLFKSP